MAHHERENMQKAEAIEALENLVTGKVLDMGTAIRAAWQAGFDEAERTRASRQQRDQAALQALAQGAVPR